MPREAADRRLSRVAMARLLQICVLWLLGGAMAPVAWSQDTSSADSPILRIETGRHGAAILGLTASRDGKLVATSSYDRTVRIWSLPGLRLVRTIRMPIGPGIEGAVYAVAFSQDGSKLATSGWTGSWAGDQGPWCLYVINVATGQFERTVCDLPRRVNHLAYSPDGKFLAVALKKAGGMRVYRTSDYSLVAEDNAYSETSTFAEFDGAGRLFTTSYDGKVRLYDAQFRLTASRAMPEGRRPESVSVSPDGQRVAVAYSAPLAGESYLPPAIDVISGDDLQVLFRADVKGIENGTLTRTVWSADGANLYASGTWKRGPRYYLRRWSAAGSGAPKDIPGSRSAILRLQALPAGGVIFAAEVPTLVLIGADDKATELNTVLADFTDIGDRFAISRDGYTVQFALEAGGAKPAYFSFTRRLMELGEPPSSLPMLGPKMEAPGLDVRNWTGAGSDRPTLNDTPLRMQDYDQSISLAIAPDDQSLVLGSKWKLYLYDRAGGSKWAKEVPFAVRGVLISADGRMIIAALGDGSIRWFQHDNGQELAAFFPDPGKRRWVAWTPSGYYMSSVGGDELIEWQVNRSRDQSADHFSAGRFKDHFYRPSVLLKSLTGLDEGRAIKEANLDDDVSQDAAPNILRLLPPVIEVLAPADGTEIGDTGVQVTVRVRSPSAEPVEQIMVRNDGYLYGTFSPPQMTGEDGGTRTLDITVPKRDSNFLFFATNRFGASEPASLSLKWVGSDHEIGVERKRLFILAIGASQYTDKALRLQFAAKDASDFVGAIGKQKGKAFSEIKSTILPNPTLAQVRAGLKWFGRAVGREDIGMVFLAGHGKDLSGGVYHFLPVDANLAQLKKTALASSELVKALASVAGHKILFIDTCHAADVFGRTGRASMDAIALVNRLSEPSHGAIVFAGSSGDQQSFETAAAGNGLFTKALIEGLRGEGEARFGRRGYITASMLQNFVKERVRDLTGGKQTPTGNMPLSVPDLLLARLSQ